MIRTLSGSLFVVAIAFGAALSARPAGAQTAADVRAAVTKACAVMSGNQKADSQFLQIMVMLDGDLSDPNPVAYGVQTGIVQQCPKSYLAFKQREHATNPFAGHPLYNGGVRLTGPSTSLLATPAPPQDYAFFCRGGSPMASHTGTTLVVHFSDPGHSASQGLGAGQCAWWSRNLRPGEPKTIEMVLPNTKYARGGVHDLDAGGTWTFWVYNVRGEYFKATQAAKGYLQSKP